MTRHLDIVNLDILGANVVIGRVRIGVTVIVKLEVAVTVAFGAVGIGLVDLRVLGELSVSLERAGLVGGVLEDNVALVVLVVSKRQEDDIALVDPDLLSEL